MEPKKSKYDTNPLDPDFVKNADAARNDGEAGSATQEVSGATREVGGSANEQARANIYSEAPTRRYDNASLDSAYPSVFVPPTYSPPSPYQPPQYHHPALQYPPVNQRPTSRAIPGIGLPEKWAMSLPYAPFFIGVIVSLIELFLVPRSEPRVRFHAAQALSLHIVLLVIQTLFSVLAAITDSGVGKTIFGVIATIFLIASMKRVWKGKPHHIAPLNDPTQWFNEHIEPRTKS